jgi:nucleotide-binding universal stress UspA family protein
MCPESLSFILGPPVTNGEIKVIRRILIALTGREADRAVLARVPQLAAQIGASITLLQVIPIADDGGESLGRQFQIEIGSSGWRRKNQADELLPRLAAQLQREGLQAETAVVVSTLSEADAIVRFAAEHGHDLIAMACDDRSWFRRWIAGSPGEAVTRKATVPTRRVGSGARRVPAAQTAPQEHPVMALFGSASL